MASTVPAPGDLVRIRDERWVVTRHSAAAGAAILEVSGRDRTNRGTRASFLIPFEVVEPMPASNAPRLLRRRRWRHLTRAMLATATPSWPSLRTGLQADISLLAFQLEPALAVTHGAASRILIADEVGLGKTIQAGLLVAETLERVRHGRALVVAPAALKDQWKAELAGRFHLDAWIADASSLARLGTAWIGSVNPWAAHPVTITSIDFVKRPDVMRSVEALVWDVVVFDEAHGLSGRSDRAGAAAALARRARTVVLLTATPHSGDDRTFEQLCRIGELDEGSPLLVFRRTRQDAGLTLERRMTRMRVRPSLAEREMHRALTAYTRMVWTDAGRSSSGARLAMTVLTRRACSSPGSLARSVERRLALLGGDDGLRQMPLPLLDTPTDEEPGAELAAPGLGDRREERRRLDRILALARRAQRDESKTGLLARLLRRTSEPAIVFTEYRDTLETLTAALRAFAPLVLHGGLAPGERRDALRRFTTGNSRLLLATDAASEGLNLQQRCRLVINLELPWTPLRLEQRIGRVERIGQRRRVHAVHLLAAGTAEESSVARLVLRARRADEVLESLRPPTPESEVARVAIGGEPAGPETRSAPLPPQIWLPGPGRSGEAEALRLERLRLVTVPTPETWTDGRPAVTILRGRAGDRRALWAFRLVFSDADQQPVWESLVGIAERDPRLALRARGSRPLAETAVRFEWTGTRLQSALDAAIERARASLARSIDLHLALASGREHAIATSLAAERARLSAGMLQPGLFDRRAERECAAQGVVLDEALSRCRQRLDEIACARQRSVDARLAFAVIRR
jgi:superfamily II DNA or RNA helicase